MSRLAADDRQLRRLGDVVRRVERLPNNPQIPGLAIDSAIELHRLKLTSGAATANRYPASIYTKNEDTGAFTLLGVAGDCWLRGPNGEVLITGKYYWAKATQSLAADGKPVYEVVSPPVSFSGAKVSHGNGEVIAANSSALLTWDTVHFDTDVYFTPGTPTRFTIPRDGYYRYTCCLLAGTVAQTGTLYALFGTADSQTGGGGQSTSLVLIAGVTGYNAWISMSKIVYAAAGATMGVVLHYTVTGVGVGALTVIGDEDTSFFAVDCLSK